MNKEFEFELARLAWEVTLAVPPAPPFRRSFIKQVLSLSLPALCGTEAEQHIGKMTKVFHIH